MYGDMAETKIRWLVPVLIMVTTFASLVSIGLVFVSMARERDALRATITALREGDGSCAVSQKTPMVVCRLEGTQVMVLPLRTGDVIVSRDCLERMDRAKRRRGPCAR